MPITTFHEILAPLLKKIFLENPFFWVYAFSLMLEKRNLVIYNYHFANLSLLQSRYPYHYMAQQCSILKDPICSLITVLKFPDRTGLRQTQNSKISFDDAFLMNFLLKFEHTLSFLKGMQTVFLCCWGLSLNL